MALQVNTQPSRTAPLKSITFASPSSPHRKSRPGHESWHFWTEQVPQYPVMYMTTPCTPSASPHRDSKPRPQPWHLELHEDRAKAIQSHSVQSVPMHIPCITITSQGQQAWLKPWHPEFHLEVRVIAITSNFIYSAPMHIPPSPHRDSKPGPQPWHPARNWGQFPPHRAPASW